MRRHEAQSPPSQFAESPRFTSSPRVSRPDARRAPNFRPIGRDNNRNSMNEIGGAAGLSRGSPYVRATWEPSRAIITRSGEGPRGTRTLHVNPARAPGKELREQPLASLTNGNGSATCPDRCSPKSPLFLVAPGAAARGGPALIARAIAHCARRSAGPPRDPDRRLQQIRPGRRAGGLNLRVVKFVTVTRADF